MKALIFFLLAKSSLAAPAPVYRFDEESLTDFNLKAHVHYQYNYYKGSHRPAVKLVLEYNGERSFEIPTWKIYEPEEYASKAREKVGALLKTDKLDQDIDRLHEILLGTEISKDGFCKKRVMDIYLLHDPKVAAKDRKVVRRWVMKLVDCKD